MAESANDGYPDKPVFFAKKSGLNSHIAETKGASLRAIVALSHTQVRIGKATLGVPGGWIDGEHRPVMAVVQPGGLIR
jgi:hypothetical protein